MLAAANSFISLGLKDLGYEYGMTNLILFPSHQYHIPNIFDIVNIDDCWAQMARVDGKMVPDTTKFPNGISGLATAVHALGLKVGIYSDAGLTTCSGENQHSVKLADTKTNLCCKGYPGSLNYETVDAATFADWGIDCTSLR